MNPEGWCIELKILDMKGEPHHWFSVGRSCVLGTIATHRCLASLYYRSYYYVLVCQLKSSFAKNAIIHGILSGKQNRRYARDANPTIGEKIWRERTGVPDHEISHFRAIPACPNRRCPGREHLHTNPDNDTGTIRRT